MAQGSFFTDNQGVIRQWSEGMVRLTGYTRDEAIGYPCTAVRCEACPTGDCPFDVEEKRYYKDAPEDSLATQLCHRNGHPIAVIKCAWPINGPGDAILGSVTTLIEQPRGQNQALAPAFRLSDKRYQKAQRMREELTQVLHECHWNKSKVAQRLGVTRVSIWRRMKQLGIPLKRPAENKAPNPPPSSSPPSAPPPKPKNTPLDLSWD